MTVNNSYFENNTANGNRGGALYFRGSILNVENTEFVNNTAATIGGAIGFSGYRLNLKDSTFTNNSANQGGAIYIDGTGLVVSSIKVTIANSKFTGNDPEEGGAIYVSAGETIVKENTEFTENSADYGGAIYVANGATLTVDTVKFTKNTAQYGGAIYAEDGSIVNIKDSEFTSNIATGSEFPAAGAVYIGDATASISGTNFTSNEGASSVGAVYIGADNAKITDSIFTGNKALAGSAGALWVNGYTVEVNKCQFVENEALAGFGGAIEWRVKEGTLIDSTFTSNKASQAGAIHWYGKDGVIKGTNIFTSNEAAQNGGAIFWEGNNGSVNGSVFAQNTAGAHGNAIYWAGANGTVDDSIFTSNTGGAGAIIWLGAEGNIKNSYFADNGNNLAVFNIYKLADDLNIEANTFEISIATINTDKDKYVYGDDVIVSGEFYWGVNDYPIDLPISWTKNGVSQTDLEVEDFQNVAFTYTIEDLNPALYTVKLEDFTEDTYQNIYKVNTVAIANFEFEKATPTIVVSAEDTDVGNDSYSITVNVTDINGDGIEGIELDVIIDGAVSKNTTDENGLITLTTDDFTLALRNSTVFAIFGGNDVYNSAYGYDTFRVTASPAVTVSIEDIPYGQDAIIEVSLKDGETGLTGVVIVTIGEDTYAVAVKDGEGTLPVPGLNKGTYTYSAKSVEFDNYVSASTDDATFNVDAVAIDIASDKIGRAHV